MPLGAFKAALMGVAGVSTGDVVLLSTQTADDVANVEFKTNIDNTYQEYIIQIYNVNPITDNADFTFNGSIDGGDNYNVVKTAGNFQAYLAENGDNPTLRHYAAGDVQNTADYHPLNDSSGGSADESSVWKIHLFNPASTTYSKHYIIEGHSYQSNDYSEHQFSAGFFDTTSAIDAVDFRYDSGNIEDGKFKLWGVK
jgi:hypothetical protein